MPVIVGGLVFTGAAASAVVAIAPASKVPASATIASRVFIVGSFRDASSSFVFPIAPESHARCSRELTASLHASVEPPSEVHLKLLGVCDAGGGDPVANQDVCLTASRRR